MAQTTKAGSFILTAPTATIGGSASIDASLTAQLGPTALSLSAASVTTGATLAWTVYGPADTDETAQIITAGSTSATPTWAAFTAAAGRIDGLWVVKCVVTSGALSTTYTRRVRVGTTKGWVLWWTALAADLPDYNWSTAPNYLTHNGAEISRYLTASFDSLNVTSGVWTVDTASATDGGVFLAAFLALAGLTNRRADVSIAIVAGVGAELTANGDGFSVEYTNNAINKGVRQCARRSGGVQQTGVGDFTGVTFKNTSGGSQVRQQCLVLGPQRLSAKGMYSPTAWSGFGLAPDDASWALAGGTASGWWQPHETVTDAATDDIFDPDVEGAGCDFIGVRFEGDNGRAYTMPGFAVWVRSP